MNSDAFGRALILLARAAIGERFGLVPPEIAALPELAEPGATFVTLTQQGQLRGCIGSLQAHRPLQQDVCENAQAAAFRDPRFQPLRRDEFPGTRVEVSLLTPAEPFPVVDEADALRKLRPGLDGLILSYGARRATFLPQVWESLPEPRQFMAQLKLKAGLPAHFWDTAIALERYGVTKWKEL